MMTTMEDRSNQWRIDVKGIIGIISAVLAAILQFTKIACDNILLQAIVTLLVIVSAIAFGELIRSSSHRIGLFYAVLGWIFVALLLVFFSITVWTSKCNEQQQTQPPQIVDQSTHIKNGDIVDQRKIYNRPAQRSLTKTDLQNLTKELTDKSQPLLVKYDDSHQEDTLIARQLYEALYDLGYLDVASASGKQTIEKNSNKKYSIIPAKTSQTRTVIFINPQ